MRQVAPFSGDQSGHQVGFVGIVAQQLGKVILRQREKPFVVPQRVICIKTDGR